jgi:hypothetical protein
MLFREINRQSLDGVKRVFYLKWSESNGAIASKGIRFRRLDKIAVPGGWKLC